MNQNVDMDLTVNVVIQFVSSANELVYSGLNVAVCEKREKNRNVCHCQDLRRWGTYEVCICTRQWGIYCCQDTGLSQTRGCWQGLDSSFCLGTRPAFSKEGQSDREREKTKERFRGRDNKPTMVRPAARKPKTTSNRLLMAMGIWRRGAGKRTGERNLWKAPLHSFPGIILLLWFHHL